MSGSGVCSKRPGCPNPPCSTTPPHPNTHTHTHTHTHHKGAYSPAEYELRRGIFDRKLHAIREHNADPRSSWKMGLNPFTDWEDKEVRRRMTGLSKDGILGRSINSESLTVHQLPADFDAARDLPASLDWRARSPSVVSPIKEQGLCGSCWAFAGKLG